MFLRKIDISYIEPCFADTEKIRLRAELSRDISELFPFLNAVIKNAVYNKHASHLTFMKEFRLISLYPTKLTLAKAINSTDALQVLDWLQNLINETYERRNEIEPDDTLKKRPTALQIYKELPRSNCKLCGELTCMAFAAKLLLGEKTLDACQPLLKEENDKLREALMVMLG